MNVPHRDQQGQVGGLEAIAFGLLIFVIGTLMVANAWAVVDAKFAVTTAARQAARTYVETGRSEQEAAAAANAAGLASLASSGRTDEPAVAIRGTYERCARIAVTASTKVPYVHVPLVGRTGSGFHVSATHTEVLDPYRTGITGEARC
jgi:hypothetical protein